MRARTPFLAAAALALAAGCAPKSMYHWSRYDENLYRHYRNPQERVAWVEALYAAIEDAEQRGLRVPPGLYAEYGYALYEDGRFPDAIAAFRQEHERWPESRALMDKMIRNAEQRAGKAPAGKAPAAHDAAGAPGRKP